MSSEDEYADRDDDAVNLIIGQITIRMMVNRDGVKEFGTEIVGLNNEPLALADSFAMLGFANLDIIDYADKIEQ